MRSSKGFFAIKIDLEKAYDRLRWSFIREMLEKIGIEEEIGELIMKCICTISSQVLWNGERTEVFKLTRGIRQGDPLSPYIFVLVMEKLTYMIQQAKQDGSWKTIRVRRGVLRLLILCLRMILFYFVRLLKFKWGWC